jgi:hypothetical protein
VPVDVLEPEPEAAVVDELPLQPDRLSKIENSEMKKTELA